MSTITIDDVKKLAMLSALELSDSELEAMRTDISNILGYVEQLSAVDTDGVTPTYQVHDLHTITRSDTVVDYGISKDELLKNAPKHDGQSVIVPRVLQ